MNGTRDASRVRCAPEKRGLRRVYPGSVLSGYFVDTTLAMKLALAATLLGSFTFAPAQTASVNLQRVLAESQEGRMISARMDAVWRPKADALAERQSNLDAERAAFQHDSQRRRRFLFWRRYVMSRGQKEAVAARLAAEQKAITRQREDLQLDFDAQRIRILSEMGKKMTRVAESYAKDHGLSLEYFDPEKRDHA
jgi:Skp family chaperone for outer membrane proteins